MKNIFLIFTFSFLFIGSIIGQQTPAPDQSQPVLISGATAHLGNGEVIENSLIGFENGKFTVVGKANESLDNTKNWKKIDATGKHIYPGLIAPNSQIGLIEIGAVRATRDADEVGSMNPNLRSIIAYNTDSKVTPTVRMPPTKWMMEYTSTGLL